MKLVSWWGELMLLVIGVGLITLAYYQSPPGRGELTVVHGTVSSFSRLRGANESLKFAVGKRRFFYSPASPGYERLAKGLREGATVEVRVWLDDPISPSRHEKIAHIILDDEVLVRQGDVESRMWLFAGGAALLGLGVLTMLPFSIRSGTSYYERYRRNVARMSDRGSPQ